MPSARASGHLPAVWAAFILGAVILLVFANSLSATFVFDDRPNILSNASIRKLWPPQDLLRPPAGAGIAARPVVNLTLALNHAVSGYETWSYHAFNLLIHVCAALLLFALVRRTLETSRLEGRYAGTAVPLAFAAALLWAIHPLQTQAVTYVIQRCESLMGCCLLLTLYAAIRGWEPGASRHWHAIAIGACLIGVGTKEVIVAAPFLVLLYDVVFVHRRVGSALRASPRLYMGMGVCLALLAWQALAISARLPDRQGLPFTPWQYAATQTEVVAHYVRLAAWPAPLVFDYGWRVSSPSEVLPAAVAALLLIAVTLLLIARRGPVGYPLAWFCGILAPTSSFLPIKDLAVEHRMYLPLAGLIVAAVLGAHAAGGRLRRRGRRTAAPRAMAAIGWLLLFLVAGALGLLTVRRNTDYHSELALWSDTVAKRPQNARAHLSLAVALGEAGRPHEARRELEEAVRLDPAYPEARANLGIFLLQQGRAREAVAHLEAALSGNPRHVDARANLGIALCQMGRHAEGIAHLRGALQLRPGDANARFNLAVALAELGDAEGAAAQLRETLHLDPGNAAARAMLEALAAPDGGATRSRAGSGP